MTIYIGIVTFNSLSDLTDCLNSVRAQQNVGLLPVTILDNASGDGTPGWIAKHASDCQLIRSDTNLGYGRGHNKIISLLPLAPGDYYLTLNPDVVLAPDYIANLSTALADQSAAWGTGKLLCPDIPEQPVGRLYSTGHALLRSGYGLNIGYDLSDGETFNQSREVFGAPGAAMMISQAAIQPLAPDGNLFDTDMFLYGEDTDLDWRARHQGYRCWYEASAVAYHRGSTPAESLRVHAVGNRYLSVIKNAHLLPLLTVNLPFMLFHCLTRLIVSPRHGWNLISQIIRLCPRMWRKRPQTMLPRRAMRQWFRWGRRQPTGQPRTIWARLKHYIDHRLSAD